MSKTATSVGKIDPDFQDVVPISPADDPCFYELYAVLQKHNALNRFGVCLLHDHFEMAPDEILTEYVDVNNRVLTMKPVKAGAVSGNVLETAWRLGPGGEIGTTTPTRRCIRNCVWENGPNGRTHHWVHKWNDSPT